MINFRLILKYTERKGLRILENSQFLNAKHVLMLDCISVKNIASEHQITKLTNLIILK